MVVKKTSPSEGSAGICPVPLSIDSYFKNFNSFLLSFYQRSSHSYFDGWQYSANQGYTCLDLKNLYFA